jgi:hypothetical protein
MRAVKLWFKLVGRVSVAGNRIGPFHAWQIARACFGRDF